MEELEERILQASHTKSQSPALPLLSLPSLTLPVPHQPSPRATTSTLAIPYPQNRIFPPPLFTAVVAEDFCASNYASLHHFLNLLVI